MSTVEARGPRICRHVRLSSGAVVVYRRQGVGRVEVAHDLLEEVLVDLDDLDRSLDLHTDAVADYQSGEALAIDQYHPRGHGGREVTAV